jgi:hypothetical protein
MDRPEWVSALEWARLGPVLRCQPGLVARDALADLQAVTATWDAPSRTALLERFASRAEAGSPLPAAFILALTDLLGAVNEHE